MTPILLQRRIERISPACCILPGDLAKYCRTSQNTAERSVSGALEPKPEVEIWRRPVFMTPRPWLALTPKVGQSTQLLPVWPRRLFSRIFRKIVNFTTFPTISGTFESTSGFRIPLTVYRLRLVAPDFLIGSISSRLSAIRRPYGPEYGKNERRKGARDQTGSRNMAATRFFDSATPTSYST